MAVKKDTIINIKPYNAEVVVTREGFTLVFTAGMAGDSSRRKKVKVHFEDWWLKYLAKLLWKVIQRRRSDVAQLEESMEE